MLNPYIKKILKILADRFEHTIVFDFNNDMTISSHTNNIKISQKTKSKFVLTYNCDFTQKESEIDLIELYDSLIQIMNRKGNYEIRTKYDLLTIEMYLQEEGKNARKEIEKLVLDLKMRTVENKVLFGNRIQPEVFNGIIILTDDIEMIRSNVMDLETTIESIKNAL